MGEGARVTVSISAQSPLPLTYTWTRGGISVPGSLSSPTLTLPSVRPSDSGTYAVTVRNDRGAVTGTFMSMTVQTAPTPTISLQPSPISVGLGGSAFFRVYARGQAPFYYQWYHDGVGVPGGTNSTLPFKEVQNSDAGSYRVRVANSGGFVDSTPATLRIAERPVVTVVRNTPSAVRGDPLDLEVSATGEGDLLYYWFHNDRLLPGAVNKTRYQVPVAEAGRYWVRVSGLGGDTDLDLALVGGRMFLDLTQENGRIDSTPPGKWHAVGSKVELRATSDPGYTFLWWLGDWEGSDIPTTVTMDRDRNISALFSPSGGTVIFANRLAGTDFDAPVFDVDGRTQLSGPFYRAQLYAGPVDGSLLPMGVPVAFRSDAGIGYLTGGSVLIRTVPAGQPAQIQLRAWDARAGATYDEAVNNIGKHGESEPFVVVTGNAGEPPSLPAYLIGLKSFQLRPGAIQSPKLLRAPSAIASFPGVPARLEVIAEGSQPMTYEWFRNGTPLPLATNRVLSFPTLLPADDGLYAVSVSNRGGTLDVPPVRVQILEPTVIALVTITPTPPEAGSPVQLVVHATGSTPFTARWELDGAVIPDATGLTFQTNFAVPGKYTVTVSGPGGSASRAVVTVFPRYKVLLGTDTGGSVTVLPPGLFHSEGALIAIEATPDPGYEFAGWHGDLVGSANPIQRTVTAPVTAQARFRPVAGTLLLANRFPAAPLDAPVHLTNGGARLEGEAWLAQLFAGSDARSLLPVGAPLPFGNGTDAGYFAPAVRVVPFLAPGAPAVAEVRVWERSAGTTFAEAATTAGRLGVSDPLPVRLGNAGTPATPPVVLTNLQPIAVAPGRAPALIRSPARHTLWLGAPLDLAVEASGHPTPQFQWSRDGAELPGAISATYRLPAAQASDSATYSVRISNALGEIVVSARVDVTPPLQLLAVTGTRSLLAGDTTELHLEVSGTAPVLYHWFAGLPGDESHPLPESSATWRSGPLFESTHLWVRVQDPGGSVSSEGIRLDVRRRPQRITFVSPTSLTFGSAPPLPVGNADSGLPVAWTVVDGPGKLLAHGRLEATGAGTLLLRLEQAGDARHEPATSVLVSVPVTPQPVTFSFANLEQRADGLPRAVEVRTDPPGLPFVLAYGGSAVPPTEPGEYLVSASVVGPNHAGRATATLRVLERAWDVFGGAYEDQDGNGFWTANESGIEGMPVRLTGVGPVRLAFTDAEGQFVFRTVTQGVYTVEQLTPQGVANTTIPIQVLTVGNAGVVPRVEFGNQSAGSVGGVAFEDTDGDGSHDPDEPGLPGLTIRLTRDRTVSVLLTQSDGRFRFTDVPPGAVVVEALDSSDLEPTSAARRSVLLADGAAASINFGARPRRTILGLIFDDSNGDGAPDGTEPGMAGVRVVLKKPGSTEVLRTAITGVRGEFAFRDLPGGSYAIEQTLPAGHVGVVNGGSPSLANRSAPDEATTADVARRQVELPENGAASANLGNYVTQRLTGVAFVDRDGNGRQGPGELGLAGIRVRVQDTVTGSVVGSAVSDGTGTYAIAGLPAGRFRVIQGEAAGHATPVSVVNLTLPERGAAAVNFANRTLGVVSGRLFLDDDRDQSPGDAEAGIGGIPIYLTQSGHPPRTALTSGDGRYLFTGLQSGEGTVAVGIPAGYQATTESSVRFLARPGSAFLATGLFGMASLAASPQSPYDRWAADSGLPADARGPAADPDLDGIANLLEFAMGTSPKLANRDGYPTLSVVRPLGEPVVAFLLPRHRVATASVKIHLETSPDLLHWSPIEPVTTVVTAGADTDLVRLFDPAGAPASGARFLRLVVRIL